MSDVICKVCSASITEPELKFVWYQEEYPHIDIGPYCLHCWGKIRVCSFCQEPHVVNETITYIGRGKYACASCKDNLKVCDNCNEETSVLIEHDGTKYCEKCFNEKFFKCDSCGVVERADYNVFKKGSGTLDRKRYPSIYKKFKCICPNCFQRRSAGVAPKPVSVCKNCGEFYTISDETKSDSYCNHCYSSFSTCEDCGKRDPDVTTKDMNTGKYRVLCTTCFNKYKKCDSCGVREKDCTSKKKLGNVSFVCKNCSVKTSGFSFCKVCLKFSEINERGVCRTCDAHYASNTCPSCGAVQDHEAHCRKCGSKRIYNYSLKPKNHFLYTKEDEMSNEPLFFGFENEVSFPTCESVRAGLDTLYNVFDPSVLVAKSDASISPQGFEIVSQPMTLSFFKTLDVNSMLPNGIQKHSSCGLHIHVSRNFFSSEAHLFKVMDFIYANETFVDKIAGRSYNNYNARLGEKVVREVKKDIGKTNRHSRVNISGKHTVEFRMFAGCITEFSLRYRVEFIHALCYWAKDLSLTSSKDTKSFVSYVEKNSKLYPNLFTFVTSKGGM